jgi:hypothetical protein
VGEVTRDASLIAVFAAEGGEPPPEWHKPTRGRPTTTARGRNAGGKEARAWLSADEYAALTARAEAAGLTLGEFVRRLMLATVA